MVLLLFGCLVAAASVQAAGQPLSMQWSDTSYGPNGPWQAVSLYIGSQNQAIDLFPGARWASTILLSDICDNKTVSTTCYAESAGMFKPKSSSSAGNATSIGGWGSWLWDVQGGIVSNYMYDKFTLPNNAGQSISKVSMTAVHDAYQTYPDGTKYPVSVGTLSLGAPNLNMTQGKTNMNYITSDLYSRNIIPSYSYGLHIGSAKLRIPGSLVLGGFDQNRIVGPVSAQNWDATTGKFKGALHIRLEDIGISSAIEDSTVGLANQTGLLSQGNTSMKTPIDVEVNPIHPYLYLPQSTCDAITANLPVTYNSSLGLYFWNTSDSQYESVLSSSSFLSFQFVQSTITNEQVTINIPFSLLNLTLDEPLVQEPTPYFPCYPSNGTAMLGQAFLQAAFVGVNWGDGSEVGHWFLAQAPGPGLNTTSSLATINVGDDRITGAANTWNETWTSYWTAANGSSSSSSTDSSGLSTGAKAGIGVGCGIAGVILIACIAAFFIRRKRTANGAGVSESQYQHAPTGTNIPQYTVQTPQELENKPKDRIVEAPSSPAMRERHELA